MSKSFKAFDAIIIVFSFKVKTYSSGFKPIACEGTSFTRNCEKGCTMVGQQQMLMN